MGLTIQNNKYGCVRNCVSNNEGIVSFKFQKYSNENKESIESIEQYSFQLNQDDPDNTIKQAYKFLKTIYECKKDC